jgi:tetratricopeptide (TPR) repeat protein
MKLLSGVLALVLCCGAARAEDAASLSAAERTRRSRAHFDLGRAHFNLGEYEAAMGEFEAGYRLKPQPLFLYNIAHSARRANQPRKALEMFKRYLEVNPAASEKKEVQKAIADLERELETAPPPPSEVVTPPPVETPPVVPPPPVETTTKPQNDAQTAIQTGPQNPPQNQTQTESQANPPITPQTNPPIAPQTDRQTTPQTNPQTPLTNNPRALSRLARPPKWYRDWVGWALTTVGTFALVIGAADFGVTYPHWSAYSSDPGTATMPNPNHTAPLYDDARTAAPRLSADIAVMCIGAAVVVGGAVRFALVARRGRAPRWSLAPAFDSRSLGVAVGGRF